MASKILSFKFANFVAKAHLSAGQGYKADCRSDSFFGTTWDATIYPGGYTTGNESDTPSVVISAWNFSRGDSFAAKVTVGLRNQLGETIYTHDDGTGVTNFGYGDSTTDRHEGLLLSKDELLDERNRILVDGSLFVDFEFQKVDPPCVYRPINRAHSNILALLDNSEDADLAFNVDGATVYAHRLILKVNAPTLAGFCDGSDRESPVSIATDQVGPSDVHGVSLFCQNLLTPLPI